MIETISKGIVVTCTAEGIPTKISKRFIIQAINKQIDAINCNTLIYFISSLLKCIIA